MGESECQIPKVCECHCVVCAVQQRAQAALENLNVYDPDPVVYKSVLNSVRSASMNCYLFEARPALPQVHRLALRGPSHLKLG